MSTNDQIEGWRGQRIAGARSRGGVFAASDWRDMVRDSVGGIEIKSRDVAARAARWFSPEALGVLSATDGRYSNVQSINSEDTVTWTALGPRVPPTVIAELLALAFGAAERPKEYTRLFWQRWPHPHTRRTHGGPEPDVTLIAEGAWCYVVEAKWAGDLDPRQGVDGAMTQLAMRTAVARAQAPDPARRGVLVIAPGPTRYRQARRGTFASYFAVDGQTYKPRPAAVALEARAVSWEQVVQLVERIDGDGEVARYLRWRLSHLVG